MLGHTKQQIEEHAKASAKSGSLLYQINLSYRIAVQQWCLF
jgi:hypothetical protein